MTDNEFDNFVWGIGNDAAEEILKESKLKIMRDATPEEMESVTKYVKSISNPTDVNFCETLEALEKMKRLKMLGGN